MIYEKDSCSSGKGKKVAHRKYGSDPSYSAQVGAQGHYTYSGCFLRKCFTFFNADNRSR